MNGSYHAAPALPNALSWADRAACRGYDLSLFFSEAALNVQEAKAICRGCPVVDECLAETLRAEVTPRYGICGGLTPDERDALIAEQARAKAEDLGLELEVGKPRGGRRPAPCGTNSAYRRHIKKGEPIDQACRAAHAAADRRLRSTGSAKALT